MIKNVDPKSVKNLECNIKCLNCVHNSQCYNDCNISGNFINILHLIAIGVVMMNNLVTSEVPLLSQNDNQEFKNGIADGGAELMEEWAYTLTAVVLFCIGFFGFTLNLLVIILMCKDIQIWTPMNIILLNLVCSDFSVSIIGNPFTLTSAIYHRWIFGPQVCVAYGFFMSLLGITSITTLTVLSYERYCLVSCPFSASHLTNKGAKITIAIIWLYTFIVTAPPLFGWGKYVNEAANISCSVNWEEQTFNTTTYIIFLFVFGLVLPVIVIIYSYVNILRTMRQNSLRSGRVNRAENRVTRMIAVMIAAFVIAWTPYAIFALIEQFGDPSLITPAMAILPALIAKSSICYNPLIYVGMNSQFRAAWKRVCGKEQTTPVCMADTTANHISMSSSKISIECSFVAFDKRKRKKEKQAQEKFIRNNNNINNNKCVKSISQSISNINNSNNKIIHETLQKIDEKKIPLDDDQLEQQQKNLLLHPKKKLKSDYELSVFTHDTNIYGKAILIRANSYKSNLC